MPRIWTLPSQSQAACPEIGQPRGVSVSTPGHPLSRVRVSAYGTHLPQTALKLLKMRWTLLTKAMLLGFYALTPRVWVKLPISLSRVSLYIGGMVAETLDEVGVKARKRERVNFAFGDSNVRLVDLIAAQPLQPFSSVNGASPRPEPPVSTNPTNHTCPESSRTGG